MKKGIRSKDAVEILGISRQTLYNWEKKRYLRSHFVLGVKYWNAADIERLLTMVDDNAPLEEEEVKNEAGEGEDG